MPRVSSRGPVISRRLAGDGFPDQQRRRRRSARTTTAPALLRARARPPTGPRRSGSTRPTAATIAAGSTRGAPDSRRSTFTATGRGGSPARTTPARPRAASARRRRADRAARRAPPAPPGSAASRARTARTSPAARTCSRRSRPRTERRGEDHDAARADRLLDERRQAVGEAGDDAAVRARDDAQRAREPRPAQVRRRRRRRPRRSDGARRPAPARSGTAPSSPPRCAGPSRRRSRRACRRRASRSRAAQRAAAARVVVEDAARLARRGRACR